MSAAIPIGIAIVEHGERYLVGVRGPEGPLPGKAEFPGGKCDPGEAPRETAVRECLEETGLAAVPVSLLEEVEFEYAYGRLHLSFWLCRPQDESRVADQHGRFRWVTAAELRSLDFPAANAGIVARLTSECLSLGLRNG